MIKFNFECEEQTVVQVAQSFFSTMKESEHIASQERKSQAELHNKEIAAGQDCELKLQSLKALFDFFQEITPEISDLIAKVMEQNNFARLLAIPSLKKVVHILQKAKADSETSEEKPDNTEQPDTEPEK